MTQLYLVLLALQNERSLKEPRVWQCLYPRFHSRRKDATSSRVISTLFQLLVNTLLLSPNGNAALEGLNYATPWHNVSCHVVSWHVTSRHVTSRHVTSRHVMSRFSLEPPHYPSLAAINIAVTKDMTQGSRHQFFSHLCVICCRCHDSQISYFPLPVALKVKYTDQHINSRGRC